MPEKDKKKYFALNHKVSVSEIQEAEAEIMKWQNEVSKSDAIIKSSKVTSEDIATKQRIIPVRGTAKKENGTYLDYIINLLHTY